MHDRISLSIRDELAKVEEIFHSYLRTGLDVLDVVTTYVTRNGGKRIRPALFLLCSRMAGASGPHLPRIAASFELIHTASLLHDDVVDDAMIRRGKPSTKAKWGNQISVLVGDFLWCKASELLVEFKNQKLLETTTRAITAITKGELLEINRQNDTTMDARDYFEIIEGKTAVLFGACAEGAGIAADVSAPFLETLRRFGTDVGMAFQLEDDALDYVSDETRFGKAAGIDLREGKLTYPLIVALEKANDEEVRTIREALIADHLSDFQFARVLEIIELHGGIEATREKAREFSERAKKALTLFKPSIERDALAGLADYAVDRAD